MNSREELLEKVNTASFAVNELNLFLDTHPQCAEALEQFRDALCRRQEALEEYAQRYGALNIDGMKDAQCWSWINHPWPWELED